MTDVIKKCKRCVETTGLWQIKSVALCVTSCMGPFPKDCPVNKHDDNTKEVGGEKRIQMVKQLRGRVAIIMHLMEQISRRAEQCEVLQL